MASSPPIDLGSGSLLDQCVAVSRLLGRDPSLVLHGGGNTSVKETLTDVTGEEIEVVHVKGSGWDLASIEAGGFAPLRRERLLRLAALPELNDAVLVNELRQASLRADAPAASIEALLHALIPSTAVLHTHADAIVALGDQVDGAKAVREALGEDVLVIDYVKPGFALARRIASSLSSVDIDSIQGIVLLKHGLFTFADDMRTAYDQHLELVEQAEAAAKMPSVHSGAAEARTRRPDTIPYARQRAELSRLAGRPLVLHRRASADVERLVASPAFPRLALRGPITPEHVIRTKRLPCVDGDFEGYATAYNAYVARHRAPEDGFVPIDPAPRVILDREAGLITAGESVAAARAAADIYEHTAKVVLAAEAMSGYLPISEAEAFDVEYWELEQAKLKSARHPAAFQGEVALVTGAASGIGRACALALLNEGSAVIALDKSEAVREVSSDERWLGLICDVADPEAVSTAVENGVVHFGGLDILIPAAGVFAASAPISTLGNSPWDLSRKVNVDGLFHLFQAAHPYLSLAPRGGRVVLIGSKNVPAPGPGAAAYSASKAAATQLARVAALEWAADGIRVNIVNPDAVFDTGLWTEELLAERAAKYGLTVEGYKRRNLLGTEVTSAQVAAVVRDLCGEAYSATTGAQVPVDGGSDRIV